jgi:nucleotide-binding universal stress UspA family protein
MYLLAVDGSDASRQAENVLVDYLESDAPELLVVNVIEQEPNPMADPESKADMQTELIDQAESLLEGVESRLEGKGFDVETSVEHGHPGTIICQRAEEQDVEGIFMGRRGLGAAGELLMGSVSQHVIHHAPCPVTLVSEE